MSFSIDTQTYRSPNHSARKNPVPSAIVLHTGEGTRKSDLEWLCKPQGEKSVSSGYYVCRDATIYQLVDDSREAWHAGPGSYLGLNAWGDFSIGIETEHKQGQDWPTIQRDALAWLCRSLIAKYGIRQAMIIAHRWIVRPPGATKKIDPTNWPDAELVAWIADLYTVDYAALWGTAAPYTAHFGIPTEWRKAIAAGRSWGKATSVEFNLNGGVVQFFESAVAQYVAGRTMVYRKEAA